MKDLWKNATIHRIGIGFLILFSINSLCASTLGALAGMEWADATNQTKIMVCIAILGNWTGVLLAFFKDTIAKIFKGEPIAAVISTNTETASATSEPFAKLPEIRP